ncbi:hypothetical protein FF32_18420 [Halomonas campaniensis]|nr:hypothetical protein FF32_18420 [Halomonas campaniensis]
MQVLQPNLVTHHGWSFSFSDTPPDFHASGAEALIGDSHLTLKELLPKELPSPSLENYVHRDQLQVAIRHGDEPLAQPLANE